ncbi:MAG TPA: DUF2071 domain-containing protein [Acidimicrobiales bacterium]|nr:DUF2071 domain-containing protein [Acidimicrobiales bacterium]
MTERIAMHQEWNSLSFVHWAYDPAVVQALLPPGLTVETYDGKAWVGLIPFDLRIRPRCTPYVPWACAFPETNVRTYVRGPDGRTGIWFLSLDAARLGAVAVARATFRLPYMWARMRVTTTPTTRTYESTRRRPHRRAHSSVVLDVGAPRATDDLAAFLTTRFLMWTRRGEHYTVVQAQHEPWRLRHGTVRALDPGLLVADGLPAPTGEPVVHVADDLAVTLRPRTGLGTTTAG